MNDRLYFRQLLSGTDFAKQDQMAQQMVNFVYLIGDRETRECVIVDPAYAVNEISDIVLSDDMNLVGALGTHYHPDHVGGKMMGWNIEGISSLLELNNIPIHIQKAEAEWVTKTTGVSASHLTLHESGDVINVGEIEITLLHTPGHTPGSQCFLVDGNLVSGDTLFLEGCGRTDLPGSNPDDMHDSLSMLASLPTDTIVYPGHRYSDPAFLALGQVRETNYVFKPTSKEGWLQWFGQ
jgi:glyoxylase-like metal-dependent hydrolase (beta-lactamase superfamily II)